MKKILFIGLLILIIVSSGFTVAMTPIEGTGASGDNTAIGKSAQIKYTLNPEATDSIKVGFSTAVVSDFSDVTALAESEIAMNVPEGSFYAELTGIYVFWQIASSTNIDIILSATDMSDSSKPANHINVEKLTTANGGGTGGADLTLTRNSGTAAGQSTLSDTVLDYNAIDFSNRCAGSKLITVQTENISGKTGSGYSGTLKVEIKAEGGV